MTWEALAYKRELEAAFVIGLAGDIPAATDNDAADFLLVVPFAVTLDRIKATVKTAPSTNTTLQLRRSTDGGASFANVSGATVTVNSGANLGVNTFTPVSIDEGDILNVSVTGGGGSGENLAVFVAGEK